MLLVVNYDGGKIMENIYWESRGSKRICHFVSNGLCYEYTTEMSDKESNEYYRREGDSIWCSSTDTYDPEFSLDGIEELYAIGAELDIHRLPVEDGKWLEFDTPFSGSNKIEVNLVNLARYAKMQGAKLFCIKRGKAYIDGEDVSEDLIQRTELIFEALKVKYQVPCDTDDCFIFPEVNAGFVGEESIRGFVEHLEPDSLNAKAKFYLNRGKIKSSHFIQFTLTEAYKKWFTYLASFEDGKVRVEWTG